MNFCLVISCELNLEDLGVFVLHLGGRGPSRRGRGRGTSSGTRGKGVPQVDDVPVGPIVVVVVDADVQRGLPRDMSTCVAKVRRALDHLAVRLDAAALAPGGADRTCAD